MQLLCLLVLSATGICVYYMLGGYVSSHILFIGELIALGLCWIPAVILYNYLTYLLFTLGALFLYKGIKTQKSRYLLLAGLLLGLNVFARTSNVVEVVLIVLVWIDASRRKGAFWKNTVTCIIGYVLGAFMGLIMMLISGGVSGITKMVSWLISLLTSSDNAGGYSAGGMVGAIISNYLKNLKWPVMILVAMLLGAVAFKILKGRIRLLARLCYLGGVVLLFVYFYRNGCFLTDYRNVSSVFGLSASVYILYFVILIYLCFRKEISFDDKLLYILGAIIIVITPLGSNNHLFACINNMFVVAPLFVAMIFNLLRTVKDEDIQYLVQVMAAVLIIIYLLQSVLLHIEYVFRDSVDGQARDTAITADSPMRGMLTNKENAAYIDQLVETINSTDCHSLVLYGNIPGVSYATKRPVAISSSWPDLDSYSKETFENELGLLANLGGTLLVVSSNVDSCLKGADASLVEGVNVDKLNILAAFIKEHNYVIYKELGEYTIYQIER